MIKSLGYIIAGGLLFIVRPAYSAERVVDRVVARVNNEAILLSEFNKRAEPVVNEYEANLTGLEKETQIKRVKEALLDQMIDEKLLLQAADEEGIQVSESELDQGVDEIKERFPTDVEFHDELAQQGYTGEDFRQSIANQLKVIKLINQQVRSKVSPPTEEELRKFYEENEEDMFSPESVEARHILIRTDDKTEAEARQKVEEVYGVVKDNPDRFSRFAEEYSEGPTASRGGNLGYFSRGDMVKEFEEAAFNLNVGQLSEPVKTVFGYHIIKVTGRRSAEKRSFAEAKDTLRNLLYQENIQEKYEVYLRQLRDMARISKRLFNSE